MERFKLSLNIIKRVDGVVHIRVSANYDNLLGYSILDDNYGIFMNRYTTRSSGTIFFIANGTEITYISEENLPTFFSKVKRFCNLLTFLINNKNKEIKYIYRTTYASEEYISEFEYNKDISVKHSNELIDMTNCVELYFGDDDEVYILP